MPDLRIRSAQALTAMDLKGYAIGGLAVGEPQAVMLEMLGVTLPELPQNKPRYLMGVGTPDDILQSVALGVDMFDCVMPTRAGRHGLAYTRRGKVNLRNARHADDHRPLDEESACPAARDYSRAYLHHLVRSGEIAGRDAADVEQFELLSGPDAGHARGHFAERFERHALRTKQRWQKGDIAVL